MTIIINPGSTMKGGTEAEALRHALRWLRSIQEDGITDVELLPNPEQVADGRWVFSFRHRITRRVATLDVHGLSDKEIEESVFRPRQYWNGSSTADPQWSDFLTPDFELRAIPKLKSEVEQKDPTS